MPSATTMKAATKKVAERRDSRIEKDLRANGFSPQLAIDIHLSEIDVDASRKNQARVGGNPVDEGRVQQYMTDLENGDEFPPLVLWERREGQKYIIVDGNHRDEAYRRLEITSCDAYIIRGARPQAVTLYAMRVNKGHGKDLTEEDKRHHALYAIDNGMNAQEAAAMFGLKVNQVRKDYNLAQADLRAERVKGLIMSRWEKLSPSARIRLNQIKLDDIFGSLTKLVMDAGLGMEDINRAVTELGQMTNFNDQVRHVEQLCLVYAEQIQPAGTLDAPGIGRSFRSPQTVFRMRLSQILVPPDPEAIVRHMTDDDRKDMVPKVEEGIKNLQAVLTALQPEPPAPARPKGRQQQKVPAQGLG